MFDEEWDFVKDYLELEEIRFGNKLQINLNKNGDFIYYNQGNNHS